MTFISSKKDHAGVAERQGTGIGIPESGVRDPAPAHGGSCSDQIDNAD